MDIFNALSEPRRRAILELLAKNGVLSATDISKKFNVTASAISQHLKVLLEANLVKVEKKAQHRIYKINVGEVEKLESWAKKLTNIWNERFDRLEELLEERTKDL